MWTDRKPLGSSKIEPGCRRVFISPSGWDALLRAESSQSARKVQWVLRRHAVPTESQPSRRSLYEATSATLLVEADTNLELAVVKSIIRTNRQAYLYLAVSRTVRYETNLSKWQSMYVA